MRIIAIIILIFGVTLAGFATLFASQKYAEIEAALAQRAAEATPQAEPQLKTKPVVVAVKALRYGEALTPDAVEIVQFPEDSLPANGFGALEELFGEGGEDARRVVLRAMEPKEPVLKSKVTGFGERATISAQLTPGMRAFTLPIDSVSGVAGFLLPNDRVDIFLTRGARENVTTNLIMQNIKVIAVDQFSDKESNRARIARTATVEVTPEDAQKLALSQQLGRMSLSLRQIDEVEMQDDAEAVSIDDIIKVEKAEPAPAPAPKKKLCVRKGTELICN